MVATNGITLPASFIWGAATAAYQIEGAVREDGRGESIWDRFSHTPGKTIDGKTGDVACDHYHRLDEDIALMKSLHLAAYRFSISWSRIIPDGGGALNQAGLDFYGKLVDKLLAANITPYITLYHWDLPQLLEDAGGWLNRDTSDRFAHYSDIVSKALGDRVKHWITLNEPWCSAFLGYAFGVHAPGQQLGFKGALAANHVLYLAHGKAIQALRANVSNGQLGITLNLGQGEPASDSPADIMATRRYDGFRTRWYLDPLYKGHYPADMIELYGDNMPDIQAGDMEMMQAPLDFLGLNFYSREVIKATANPDPVGNLLNYDSIEVPGAEFTEMHWEVAPDALYRHLARVHRDYNPPAIFITENGAAFDDMLEGDNVHDTRRVEYLRGYIGAVGRAVAEGVPVHGYFVWSLFDNFEWGWGYTKRFGVIFTDYDNAQRRVIKDSGKFYAAIVQNSLVPTAESV